MRTSVRGAEYLRLLRGKHLERGVQEAEKAPVNQHRTRSSAMSQT